MADEQAKPPFNKKSSVAIVNEAEESSKESLTINRDDFWATTRKHSRTNYRAQFV